MSFLVLVVSQKVLYHRKGKGVQMCINTHCTPFKITKYYTTIKVKARVQPLKKLKSLFYLYCLRTCDMLACVKGEIDYD